MITGRERKLSGSTGASGGVASYQPFSASQEPPPPEEKPAPRVKNLYDSFVTAREKLVIFIFYSAIYTQLFKT